MVSKIGRMKSYLVGLLTKTLYNTDHAILQGHMTNNNQYISTIRVPMATRLGRMITFLDGLLSIKSDDPLILWSCKITCQTEIISPPP